MIFFSLSPDLRDIKGTKLECISCQINNLPLEAQDFLTMKSIFFIPIGLIMSTFWGKHCKNECDGVGLK